MDKLFLFVLFSCLLALLSGCSTHSAPDGPPHYYVDETSIPNAIPRYEALSKYGNMPSYVVLGHRYYVLPSSKHYDQIGMASWYGTRFHTHLTSDHERYNMLAMTAAHRTLPLPTYVEVTNLQNHRKIIVKVNDRGPFASGRIIDLSYIAAKKLGMLGHGTALVRVRAIDSLQNNPGIQVATNKSNAFYLQVGAFRHLNYAQDMQHHLTNLITVPINIRHPSPENQLYRVQLGPFDTLESANKMTNRLRQWGIQTNKIEGA